MSPSSSSPAASFHPRMHALSLSSIPVSVSAENVHAIQLVGVSEISTRLSYLCRLQSEVADVSLNSVHFDVAMDCSRALDRAAPRMLTGDTWHAHVAHGGRDANVQSEFRDRTFSAQVSSEARQDKQGTPPSSAGEGIRRDHLEAQEDIKATQAGRLRQNPCVSCTHSSTGPSSTHALRVQTSISV